MALSTLAMGSEYIQPEELTAFDTSTFNYDNFDKDADELSSDLEGLIGSPTTTPDADAYPDASAFGVGLGEAATPSLSDGEFSFTGMFQKLSSIVGDATKSLNSAMTDEKGQLTGTSRLLLALGAGALKGYGLDKQAEVAASTQRAAIEEKQKDRDHAFALREKEYELKEKERRARQLKPTMTLANVNAPRGSGIIWSNPNTPVHGGRVA